MFPTEPCPDEVRAGKRIYTLTTAIVVLVLLSPLAENWKARPQDSFPLSYYPMFSHRRADTYAGNALLGVDADGKRMVLSYRLAGHGGFNQVRRQLAAKLKEKQGQQVCQHVASNVAQSNRGSLSTIQTVQVVSQKHHIHRFFARQDSQLGEKVYATCTVPRDTPLTVSRATQSQTTSEVHP